jgi:hypothetical protein
MATEHKGIDFVNVIVSPYDKSEWCLEV